VWILFVLYPIGVIPFTYVTSFIFTSENVAQTVTIFLHFVFAGIGAIVQYVLQIISSTFEIGDRLNWALKIVPSFCLTHPIIYSSGKERLFMLRPELKKDSDLDLSLIGGDILIMCIHFVFWTILLILIEVGAFNCFRGFLKVLKKNRIPLKTDIV
jgi:hypothetical protein